MVIGVQMYAKIYKKNHAVVDYIETLPTVDKSFYYVSVGEKVELYGKDDAIFFELSTPLATEENLGELVEQDLSPEVIEKIDNQISSLTNKIDKSGDKILEIEAEIQELEEGPEKQELEEKIAKLNIQISNFTERIETFTANKSKKVTVRNVNDIVLKTTDDGNFTHKYSLERYNDIEKLLHNYKVDQETFALIKRWCSLQPEGCEEAFLGLEKNSNRYKDYTDKREEIIASRTQYKQTIESDLTLEDISDLIRR